MKTQHVRTQNEQDMAKLASTRVQAQVCAHNRVNTRDIRATQRKHTLYDPQHASTVESNMATWR